MTKKETNKDESAPQDQEVQQDPAAEAVQHAMAKAQERGYFGVEQDQTPNENYTVAGVTSNAPTPETDAEQAKKAQGDV